MSLIRINAVGWVSGGLGLEGSESMIKEGRGLVG